MYIGFVLLIIGNGFFKLNIFILVGDFYEENDFCCDGVFIIFYMGINFGVFFVLLVVGLMSYKYGFLIVVIGMVVG